MCIKILSSSLHKHSPGKLAQRSSFVYIFADGSILL
jgi:hypothetical protein